MSGPRPVISMASRVAVRQTFRAPRPQAFPSTHTRPNVRHHLPRTPFAQRRTFIRGQPPGSFFKNAKTLFYHYPISISIATAAILVGFFGIGYVNYFYQKYIIGAFIQYPEEVAKPMRKALYYTNYDLQPQEALKYYKQALLTAEELNLDPFTDAVMGIKFQLAAFLEKVKSPKMAIEVLERVRNDNLKWLELYGGLPDRKKQRTNVLAKTISLSIKLGELYADGMVWNRELAEERLVWAVENALKEQQRRQNEKVTEEEEGPWLSASELGASIESLAHTYEASNQHYLATPLFLQALSLYPTQDCHTVILMNNLASSLAQQSPRAARAAQAFAASKSVEDTPAGPVATRESMIQNAKMWAQKALDVAAGLSPPVRTEECDVGCAVALHNLGEFAEMNKDFVEAKKKYQEALSLARAVKFEEGVENTSARLRELEKKG